MIIHPPPRPWRLRDSFAGLNQYCSLPNVSRSRYVAVKIAAARSKRRISMERKRLSCAGSARLTPTDWLVPLAAYSECPRRRYLAQAVSVHYLIIKQVRDQWAEPLSPLHRHRGSRSIRCSYQATPSVRGRGHVACYTSGTRLP